MSELGASLPQRLLYRLASEPGERGTTTGFVSGALLSTSLGVSRSAVWKAALRLRELGVEVEGLPRQGYRLALPCSPLSTQRLRELLPAATRDRLHELEVCWHTGSTNADLLARPPPPGRFSWRLAEHQSAGRGRRGRTWLAAPGAALCLSWSWRFDALPPHISSLGLALGIAAVHTLERLGFTGAGLKWPNDLVTADGKLAGILIELVSEAAGPALVVVGIGLNVALGAGLRDAVRAEGNRASDLRSLLRSEQQDATPDRNQLAAALVGDGIAMLQRWENESFASLMDEWQRLDRLRGQEVVVRGARDELHGIARGVDLDGALLLDDGNTVHRCASGEASVRIAEQ
jgi:BirA family transcriptional regulator, biotin operon repressor / biotin---[acetyl-CoA-carboxylase] ligase